MNAMLRYILKNVKFPHGNKRWFSRRSVDEMLDAWKNKTTEGKETNNKLEDMINTTCDTFKTHIPNDISVHVIGTGAPGAPASILIYTERQRYLINCGEGTQRLLRRNEHWSRGLTNIFITRTNWQCIGGLTTLDVFVGGNIRNLSLHGPPKLKDAFSAVRGFVDLKQLQIDYFQNGEFFEDFTLSMTSVPLHRIREKCEEEVNVNNIQSNGNNQMAKQRDTLFDHENLLSNEKHTVMAYICKIKDQVRALDVKKCIALGATSRAIERLERGVTVVLPDGKKIVPGDVLNRTELGPVVIFIDVPNRDFLKSLRNCTAFKEYHKDSIENSLALIVHFTPSDITNTAEYQEFLAKFPKRINHWFLNKSNKFSGLVSSHQFQCKLNALNDNIFPMLGESKELLAKSTSNVKRNNSHRKLNIVDLFGKNQQPICTPATVNSNQKIPLSEYIKEKDIKIDEIRSYTSFHLRPLTGIDHSKEVEPHSVVNDRAQFKLASLKEIQKFKDGQQKQSIKRNRDEEYPRFVFLGTGSAPSSELRNVSGILFYPKKNRSMIIDCGEGTANQIHRFYGSKADEIFEGIKCIAISHLHNDHHIGLLGILQERRRILGGRADPILLCAPAAIEPWLSTYDQYVEPVFHEFELICNEDMLLKPTNNTAITDVGLKTITTCEVDHSITAFGFCFIVDSSTSKTDEIKITYSGDTAPCQSLVELGYESTLLIHESTFANKWAGNAPISKHSTDEDALEQRRKMNAKFIILTHFSQGRKNIPRVNHDLTNAGLAVDNMEVTLYELDELTKMYPIMQKMF